MNTAPSLRWVKPPQQARSQDTLARLLDAAEVMLEEAPWEAITVQALVTRGKSSVGAFYARFPDKDALLQHLDARRSSEAVQTADEALAREQWIGVPLEVLVRGLVAFAAQDYTDHAGLHRELVRRHSIDARFRERAHHVSSHTCRLLAALLEDRKAELMVKDSLRAADTVHRIVFAMLDQQVQFYDRPAALLVLTAAELVDEIVRTVLAYLRVRD